MILTKFLYFILFIISAAFYILFTGDISFYLLIFIVSLPVLLAITVLIAKLFIIGSIEIKSNTAIKNSKIDLSLCIKNKTPLPFSNSNITIEYYNNLINVKEKMLISIPIHQVCTEKVDFSLKSDYCGIFNVKIKSIQIFDFIKLFSVRIKNKKTCQITVLPELYPIITANTPSIINTEESNIFSKHKSGDDPSEIFELKDYVQGDKPNKIHWKLSLKHDNYIVRHYSQPISSSILVMLDFSGEPSKRHIISLDTAAEMAFSILVFFIENETPAKFSYFDAKKGSEEIMPATDISEITTAFKNIFLNYPTKHNSLGSILLDSTQNYSKIFYITYDPNNLSEVYKKNNCENFVPIFIKNLDNDKSPKFEFPENAIIIPAGKTGEIISNILI